MIKFKLTYDETVRLEKSGSVYCLRDRAVYLVEKIQDRYDLTVFLGSNFELIKTYQKTLDK